MNDSNDIGFNIRARILPQIEGVNELEQNLNNIIGQDGTPRANPGAGIPILPGTQSTETPGQNTQAALTPSQILLIEQTQEFLKRSGLEQSLKDIPNKMGQNISDVVSSPEFLKTLNPQQAKDAGEWLKYSQGLYEPLNDRINETLQDLNVDLSAGKLTKSQQGKYLRKFERIKSATDEVGTNLTTDASSFFHPDQEHLEMIRSAISASKDDVGANIDEVKNKFIGLSTSINEVSKSTKDAHEQTQSFFQQFQKMGAFALGGEAVTSVLDYMTTTAQIAAKGKTAFDLTSPMAMFSERTAFETYKDVTERTRDYQLYGKLIGGVGGALIGGGPLGALAGGYFGGMAGKGIAELANIPEQAETQEQLKYLNQTYGAAAGLVESARPYEIAAKQMDIRFGTNMRSPEGYLGYDADRYLKMRSALAEGLGRENTGLEKEQIAFARSTGLNPEDLAQFNVVQRLGGQSSNAQYLTSVEQMTKQEFGKDADNKRIIDVLESIKEIQMKQLTLGVDSKTAIEFGRLPELLLGVNNPLGRMGDLGSQTLQGLSTLGTANSPAQEAMLYQALGQHGMFGEKGYLANKTRGFWDPENFKNIMETWGKDFAGNEKGAEAALFNYAPDMNAESRIKLARVIAGEKIDVVTGEVKDKNGNVTSETHQELGMNDILKMMSEPSKQSAAEVKKMFGDASKSATDYETTEQQIRKTNLEAAEKFKETILDSQKLQATFWNNMANSERLQEGILAAVKKGYEQLNDWMVQHGFISDPKQIQENYNNKKYNTLYSQATEMLGNNKYNAEDLKSQGKSIDDYESYLAKYIFEHNPAYGLQKGKEGQEYILNRLKANSKLEELNKEEQEKLKDIVTPDLGLSWRQRTTKEINDSFPRGYHATIGSGYRTPAENAALPHSVSNSEHLIGYAEDLSITKDGKLLNNEDLYKDKAWWNATKALQKKDPDLDFGLYFKKNPLDEANHIQSRSHEESVTGKGSTSYNEGYENNIFSNRLNELTASISELSNRLGVVLDNKTKVDINVKSQDHFIEFQTKQVGIG